MTGLERRVVETVGRGFRKREIARTLGITEKTVKTHPTTFSPSSTSRAGSP